MNLNLLDEESIQPSEPTPCDFFKGENAIKKAKRLGLPDLELVRNAIMIGDADYRTNTHYNRARFIARWEKIAAQRLLTGFLTGIFNLGINRLFNPAKAAYFSSTAPPSQAAPRNAASGRALEACTALRAVCPDASI